MMVAFIPMNLVPLARLKPGVSTLPPILFICPFYSHLFVVKKHYHKLYYRISLLVKVDEAEIEIYSLCHIAFLMGLPYVLIGLLFLFKISLMVDSFVGYFCLFLCAGAVTLYLVYSASN